MKTRLAHLRVKIKYLACEAGIIRFEEKRSKHDPVLLHSLTEHRRGVVRDAARHALLAYGFLRGLDYSQMEASSRTPPDFEQVGKLVERFGACQDAGEPAGEYLARKKKQKEDLAAWAEGASRTLGQAA